MRRFNTFVLPLLVNTNIRKPFAWQGLHSPSAYMPKIGCACPLEKELTDKKKELADKNKEVKADMTLLKSDFASLQKTVADQGKAIFNLMTATLLHSEYTIRNICGEYLLFAVGNQPKKGKDDSAFFDQDALPLHLQSCCIRMKVPTILSLMPFLPEDDKEAKVLLDSKINNRNNTLHCGSAAMLKRRIEECLSIFEMFPELKQGGRLEMEYKILLTYDALRAANIF